MHQEGGARLTAKPIKPESDDHDEEKFFEECLREHGQLADEEGAELPPGATHQMTTDANGERKVTRKRFSAF